MKTVFETMINIKNSWRYFHNLAKSCQNLFKDLEKKTRSARSQLRFSPGLSFLFLAHSIGNLWVDILHLVTDFSDIPVIYHL